MLIFPDRKNAETSAYRFSSSSDVIEVICFASVYHTNLNHLFFHHTNTKLDTSCIFSQTEPRRRVDAWPPCWSVGAISLSHEHNDASHSSGTAARFSTLALPTFALTTELHRCYSCDISVSAFS